MAPWGIVAQVCSSPPPYHRRPIPSREPRLDSVSLGALMDLGQSTSDGAFVLRRLLNTTWCCMFLGNFIISLPIFCEAQILCLWIQIMVYMFTNVLIESRSHGNFLAAFITVGTCSFSEWKCLNEEQNLYSSFSLIWGKYVNACSKGRV